MTLALMRSEGNVTFWWANANDFPAWPRPATTDALGHFTVHGVGRNMRAFLTARHPRFALHEFTVETDDAAESKPMTLALEPAKIISGRLTYGDTGKPVATPRLPSNQRRPVRNRFRSSRPMPTVGSARIPRPVIAIISPRGHLRDNPT